MKQIASCLTIATMMVFLGCNKGPDTVKMEMADQTEMADQSNIAPTDQKNSVATTERKLIKVGTVEFKTEDLDASRKTIFAAVKKFDGYVSQDREYKIGERKTNTVVIRVPASDFDQLLGEATLGVDKFESKEIKVKDVTEEFLDVEARLKTKKQLEQRFINLLEQAKNVTEILEIEKQIANLRSEIESIEGRLKCLKDQVSFSTLTMTFYENVPNQTEFGGKFKKGFSNGWDNLVWFFVAITNIWPFILIGIAFFIGFRRYNRKG